MHNILLTLLIFRCVIRKFC